jgi:hypothetical protein
VRRIGERGKRRRGDLETKGPIQNSKIQDSKFKTASAVRRRAPGVRRQEVLAGGMEHGAKKLRAQRLSWLFHLFISAI